MLQPLDLPIRVNDVDKANFALHQAGKFQTDWHQHIMLQMVYAEYGTLYIYTDSSRFLLPAGHAAILPPQLEHYLYSNSPHLFLRSLYFSPVESNEILQELCVFPVSSLAREMILYTQRWQYFHPATEIEQHFLKTIYLLLPQWAQSALSLHLPDSRDETLAPIIEFILANIGESLTITTLAHQSGFSGRTIQRLFQRELGMTVGSYLRIARIIRAIELLTESKLSVTDIAYAVGYASPTSFHSTFQALTGLTPMQYRKQAESP